MTNISALPNQPGDLPSRLCLAVEELAEWVEAHSSGDLVAAADAWGDRMYVLLGDAVASGMPVDDIFQEVHRSNMTKLPCAGVTNNKGIKGRTYTPPSIYLPTPAAGPHAKQKCDDDVE